MSDHVKGQYHCGTVKFEAELIEGGFDSALRCTCSLCRMRGAVVVLAKTGDAEKRMIIVEYGLKVRTQKSHAAIRDLTTS